MKTLEEPMIKKETPTDYEIHPLIKQRWSPRAFSENPISEKELKQLFEAGRWAASSNNFQPWRIIYGIKGTDVYNRIFKCLDEFNQGWNKTTQVLLLGAFKKTNKKGKENFHALHDLGQFMANLSIQAQSMGIAIHQMAGVDFKMAIKEFEFPEDYHVATAVAIGYYGGDIETLPEDLQEKELQKERKRKPQEEFIFNGNFKE
ncbi:nitroreductase family protein [Aegicerativicinus sediminis]|uniref:nitroreductase family protein n=1 Tax=Aegicerativicinus sediminis TaxID=2893202 RepID=UPI001E3BEC91|nr:nitroreductase family protein [Aegicerativicinus sediminis]